MTTAAWILIAAAAGYLGALVHGVLVEARHHCMPHDADSCRDTTGETR